MNISERMKNEPFVLQAPKESLEPPYTISPYNIHLNNCAPASLIVILLIIVIAATAIRFEWPTGATRSKGKHKANSLQAYQTFYVKVM